MTMILADRQGLDPHAEAYLLANDSGWRLTWDDIMHMPEVKIQRGKDRLAMMLSSAIELARQIILC